MLAKIAIYRLHATLEVQRALRNQRPRGARARRRPRALRGQDVDVSLFPELASEFVNARDHRRVACEAKAELWRHIRAGDIENGEDDGGESMQTFEEMSHTE